MRIGLLSVALFAGLICRAQNNAAFYAPGQNGDGIAEAIGACFKNDKRVKIGRISRITAEELRNYKALILWGTKIEPKQAREENSLNAAEVAAVRSWVENGGGLLCFHDAVGLEKHDSKAIFPEAGEGINNYYPDQEPYTREGIVTRSHPVMEGIPEGSRFVVSYFDVVNLKPGEKGVVLARKVIPTMNGGMVEDAAIVAARIGKGRYVACGFATGLHASNTPIAPLGTERAILINAVHWLIAPGQEGPVSPEIANKGELLGKRNLVNNSSMEIVENGFPVGWGKSAASGKFEWGVSSTEKHSGNYSVYVKAIDYSVKARTGNKVLGGGIQSCGGDWENGISECVVKPNTEYEFSFWMKTTSPSVRIGTTQWLGQKKAVYTPTGLDWMKPADDSWRHYSGKIVTSPATKTLSLDFLINGRNEKWGRNPGVPLGSTIYLDDVALNELASIPPLAEQREARFVRMAKADWTNAGGVPPEPIKVAPGTPLRFNQEYLAFPAFANLPRGGVRIDLNGAWKIKKFYGVKDGESQDPGMTAEYWRQSLSDNDWQRRQVPSGWYSDDTPEISRTSGSIRSEICTLEKDKPFPWVGWYRREFKLPPIDKGKSVILNFERVSYQCQVWVNGEKVGVHTGGRTPFCFDIGKAVKPNAENTLAVRVFDPVKIYDWRHWAIGGIWDVVYVDIVPEIHARRTLITPNLEKSTLEVDAWIDNAGPEKRSAPLSAIVKSYPTPFSSGANYDKTADLGPITLNPGANPLKFTVKLDQPVYWTPENPFLYTLELKFGEDYIAKDRFGFRSFVTKDSDFLLNGKPVFLRGECFSPTLIRFRPGLLNPADKEFAFMKKMLMSRRQLNINNLYPMITPLSTAFYNVSDELGFTIYGEWHAAQAAYPRNEPIESESGLKEMEAWVYNAYNHPSLAMWSLGGELYERYHPNFAKTYDEYLNPLYDMVKKLDKQGRPVCQSSGRIPNKDSKTDLWDAHAYPGAISGSWTEEDNIIDSNIAKMRALYGNRRIPFIQYEVGGFERRWNADAKACEKAGIKANNDWNKDAFIQLAQKPPLYHAGVRWTSAVYGTRRWLKDLEQDGRYGVQNQKMMIQNVLAMARCHGLLSGIGANNDAFAISETLDAKGRLGEGRSFFRGHYCEGDLNEKVFVASEGYEDLKRVYNPALICWLLYPKNNFAGKTFSSATYVVNDTGRELANLSARVAIKDPAGKVVSDTMTRLVNIPNYKRLTFPYEVKLSGDHATGDYRAELFLYENNEVIADAHYDMYILAEKDWNAPIVTAKKVAVYDKGAAVIGENTPNTSSILREMKVPFQEIDDFKNLGQYDVLILGAYSVSPLMTAGNEINEWLKNGGRLLAFEQMLPGPVPFLPQLQIIAGYSNICADIITISHPAFKDLSCYNFFRWNGNVPGVNNCPGSIFSCAIKPMNKTMVMVGATAVPRNSLDALSMTLSDVKVGKGMAALSQLEATCRYGTDSAATQYIRNLVKYVLSDEMGYSTPLDTFTIGNVNLNECGLVDLAAGERRTTRELCFEVPKTGVEIRKNQTVTIDLTKNRFYDPGYEAKYAAEHVDEGGLQNDYMEKIYFLYGCRAVQPGKSGAALTIRYANGEAQKVILTGGGNLAGAGVSTDLPMAVSAGDGLFITSWQNPYPSEKIKALEICAIDAEGFVLKGVTCELIRARTHK